MSRTIKEIYNEAIAERNRRLELTEFAVIPKCPS